MMGKIFDAFTKAADSIADPALHSGNISPVGSVSPLTVNGNLAKTPVADMTGAGMEAPIVSDDRLANNEGAPLVEPSIFSPSRARTLPIRVPIGDPMLPFDAAPSRASEQYRYLRTKLIQHSKKPRSIMVSSPGPGDGKSVTAVNLAGVLSLKGADAVVLVDADLRRASLHHHLGIPQGAGLADVLQGTCQLQDVLIHLEQLPNLFLIPAGESKNNPAELLDSAAWSVISQKLRNEFKYVVIDSPPVDSVADFHLLEATCDGVVLVMRPDHTSRTLAMKALEMIPKEKSLGVVLNCVEDWSLMKHSHYDYAYSYWSKAVKS
jgi:protein-tyrosine kinase